MDFLDFSVQYLNLGYPPIIFYLLLAAGVLLLLFKPRWAFYFAIFCLAARDFQAAVFTRPTAFGSFLNMNDLLLWISVFAMLRYKLFKTRIWMPKILVLIFILIVIGAVQSIAKYGFGDSVLRPIWQSAVFPIMFFVGANMVDSADRAKSTYWMIFFGAVLASIQHVFATRMNLDYAGENYLLLRTIAFTCNGGIFLIMVSFFNKPENIKKISMVGWYIGLSLVGLSYFLSLTRTIWLGAAAGIIIMWLIIARDTKFHRVFFRVFGLIVFPALVISIVLSVFLPTLNIKQMLFDRVESFSNKDTFDESYETRYRGSQRELNLWTESPFLIGIGTALPPDIQAASSEENESEGVFYHVGLTAYLAHYGILGVFIYVLLLPFLTIKISRRVYRNHLSDYIGTMALLAIACSLMDALTVMSSTHYLLPTGYINAIIYGGAWALYKKMNNDSKKSEQDIVAN